MLAGVISAIILLGINIFIAEFVSVRILKRIKSFPLTLAVVFVDFFFRLLIISGAFFIIFKQFHDGLVSALGTFALGITFSLGYKVKKEMGKKLT